MGAEEPRVESSGGNGLQKPGPLCTSRTRPGVGVAWAGTGCFCLSLFLFGLRNLREKVESKSPESKLHPAVASLLTRTVNPCAPLSLHVQRSFFFF